MVPPVAFLIPPVSHSHMAARMVIHSLYRSKRMTNPLLSCAGHSMLHASITRRSWKASAVLIVSPEPWKNSDSLLRISAPPSLTSAPSQLPSMAARFLSTSRIRPGRQQQSPPCSSLCFRIRVCSQVSGISRKDCRMEGVLLLATLAQGWKLRLVPGHPVEPAPLITLRSKYGMRMCLERRNVRLLRADIA